MTDKAPGVSSLRCMKCGANIVECECPDCEERLEALRGIPFIDEASMVDKPLRLRAERRKNPPATEATA